MCPAPAQALSYPADTPCMSNIWSNQQAFISTAHKGLLGQGMTWQPAHVQVFCHQFGYGLTVTADKEEPIDIGMQFVKSGHYSEAIAFLDELVEKYQMRHPILFTAGQMSMMASAGL